MYIFIDESGLFAPVEKRGAWSTVGGLVIPEGSLNGAEHALRALKKSHDIPFDKEFKKVRPGCDSRHFRKFIHRLVELDCTLHVMSTRGSPDEAIRLDQHIEGIRDGINNYADRIPDSAEYAAEVVASIPELSAQQHNQCVLQSHMICDLSSKMLSYYSNRRPKDLARFKWMVDAKDDFETKYEQFFKSIYIGIFQAILHRRPMSLLGGEGRDYEVFLRSYAVDVTAKEVAENNRQVFGKDLSEMVDYMKPVDYVKMLSEDFNLVESVSSPGIQMADLLVSGVNRCLKQNYDDIFGMAKAFGELMVNSPFVEEQAIKVMGHGETREIEEPMASLLNLMDASSKKLYSHQYRVNMSRRQLNSENSELSQA